MTRRARVTALATCGVVAAIVTQLVDPGSTMTALAVLATGLVIGELLELRPEGRAPIPLSFAVLVVLARVASNDFTDFAIVCAIAFAVGVVLRDRPTGAIERVVLYAERLAEAAATALVFDACNDALASADDRVRVLVALFFAALAPLVVAELVQSVRERRLTLSTRGRSADLALVTSAMLMAIGYRGIAGDGKMGLWGPVLFSIPLLAAWYSFEQLASIRRTYDQTITALAAAPELGGLVAEGHAARVAALCDAMGRELGLGRHDLDRLRVAASLHHVGQVCLDVPTPPASYDPVAVAEITATMLRDTESLAPAGDLVDAARRPHRAPLGVPVDDDVPRAATVLGGQVLRVASDFDDRWTANGRRVHAALEDLYSGPGYVYDGRVLAALERVLDRGAVALA